MNIKTVLYSKTYPINGVFWEKILVEAEVSAEDDPRKALYECKKIVENFHYESNKAAEKTQNSNTIEEKLSVREKILRDISTCTEEKVLESYKLLIKNDQELEGAYNNQLEKIRKSS